MDNDALMRRIALQTKNSQKIAKPAGDPIIDPSAELNVVRPTRVAPTVNPVHDAQSHLASILKKEAAQAERDSIDNANQSQAASPPPAPPVAQTNPATQPTVPQPVTQPPAAASVPFEPGQSKPVVQHNNGPSIGRLIACDGVNATICADASTQGSGVTVGQMLTIPVETNRIIGLVHKVESEGHGPDLFLHAEMQGEIRQLSDGEMVFSKGVSRYPAIGSSSHLIEPDELATLYASTGTHPSVIGQLAQADDMPAFIDIESMLAKHFAVMGSTGSGKSSAVSLLLRTSQQVLPELRTVLLDPHDEYSSAFPEANRINAANLEIPFWLFQLEEYAEVLFRGKPIIHEEVDALREMIPDARQRYREGEERLSLRSDPLVNSMTADTPVPYRISDILAIIDEELGLLEARYSRSTLKSLKARITAHCNDPRYRFMFRDRTISDKAEPTLDAFFNLTSTRSNCTVLEMAGMPSEVVNAVASVLCRLAFELCVAARGKIKILMVCEEAHRYVPADPDTAFEPTRRAISRIAKEGRKYGSYMGIISQRPAELDPTILSQCSTVFALRLSNELDQSLIRKAISNSSRSTVSFLSALANREAIAFGEGFSAPMRLRFSQLPDEWLPGRDQAGLNSGNAGGEAAGDVFRSWRGVAGLTDSSRLAS